MQNGTKIKVLGSGEHNRTQWQTHIVTQTTVRCYGSTSLSIPGKYILPSEDKNSWTIFLQVSCLRKDIR